MAKIEEDNMEVVLTAVHHVAGQRLSPLWAYIDPSTGSLLFQVAAASLISAGLFVRGVRDRVTWLFSGGWRTKPDDQAPTMMADSATAGRINMPERTRKAA
jgi:hypothetical protein